MARPVDLKSGWVHHRPQRKILTADMCCRAPGGLLLLRISVDPRHDVDTPAEIGAVWRIVGTTWQLLPGSRLGVIDIVRAGQDVEADNLADDRCIAGIGTLPDVSPP